ncbi:unnamed protein product [Closterium sp. NIES-54]
MHPIPFPIFQPILSPPPLLFPSSSTTSSITSNREGRARGSSGGGGCSGGRMKERLCCPPSPPPSPAVLSFPSSSITSSITSTREGRARGSSGAAVARDGGGLRTTEPFLPPSSAPSPPRSPLLLFPQFLYYLIDRFYQGGQSEGQQRWRGMVEDFGASMDVGDGHVVETMVMVMVDECTEEGLKACSLIPHLISLSSPSSSSSSSSAPPIHPRIARVLIERGKPEPALQILRACSPGPAIFQACSTPGSATPVFPNLAVPLEEAVTALRVLIENRLLTEAFLYLRAYCKQLSINDPSSPQPLADAPDSADAADGSDATVSAAVGSADNEAAKSSARGAGVPLEGQGGGGAAVLLVNPHGAATRGGVRHSSCSLPCGGELVCVAGHLGSSGLMQGGAGRGVGAAVLLVKPHGAATRGGVRHSARAFPCGGELPYGSARCLSACALLAGSEAPGSSRGASLPLEWQGGRSAAALPAGSNGSATRGGVRHFTGSLPCAGKSVCLAGDLGSCKEGQGGGGAAALPVNPHSSATRGGMRHSTRALPCGAGREALGSSRGAGVPLEGEGGGGAAVLPAGSKGTATRGGVRHSARAILCGALPAGPHSAATGGSAAAQHSARAPPCGGESFGCHGSTPSQRACLSLSELEGQGGSSAAALPAGLHSAATRRSVGHSARAFSCGGKCRVCWGSECESLSVFPSTLLLIPFPVPFSFASLAQGLLQGSSITARYKAALSAHKQVWAIEAAVEAEQESEEANNEDEEGRQERGSEDGEKEEGGSPMDATAGAAAVGTAGADVVAKGASRKRRRGGKGLTVQLREKRIRLLESVLQLIAPSERQQIVQAHGEPSAFPTTTTAIPARTAPVKPDTKSHPKASSKGLPTTAFQRKPMPSVQSPSAKTSSPKAAPSPHFGSPILGGAGGAASLSGSPLSFPKSSSKSQQQQQQQQQQPLSLFSFPPAPASPPPFISTAPAASSAPTAPGQSELPLQRKLFGSGQFGQQGPVGAGPAPLARGATAPVPLGNAQVLHQNPLFGMRVSQDGSEPDATQSQEGARGGAEGGLSGAGGDKGLSAAAAGSAAAATTSAAAAAGPAGSAAPLFGSGSSLFGGGSQSGGSALFRGSGVTSFGKPKGVGHFTTSSTNNGSSNEHAAAFKDSVGVFR